MKGKKRLQLFGGIALLLFILPYIFLILPAQKRFRLSHNEVVSKIEVLRGFLTGPKGPPTRKEIERLGNEIEILEERYRDIEQALIHKVEAKTGITPVEFGKILDETKTKLLQEAKDAGIGIPPDLGFKDTIPTSEEVRDMVKELDAITFVVREGIASRFGDIKGIKYTDVEVEGHWEKVGMELEISGSFGDVVDFLYNLSQRPRIYIIKSLEIKNAGGITRGSEEGPRASEEGPRARTPASAGEGRRRRPEVIAEAERPRERPQDRIAKELVSCLVHLESYNYIADNGN